MPFQPKEWEPNPRWVPREQRTRRQAVQAALEGTGKPPAAPAHRGPHPPSELLQSLPLFGIAFAALLLVAMFVNALHAPNLDAITRTVDAHNVLYSRDPHLGAIGFTWPPLPTALRLPLLMLLHPLGVTEFAGPLTSVLAAAGCVVLLDLILRQFEVPRGPRLLWIAATLGNPIAVLHFTNGTAEALFAFFFLAVVRASLRLGVQPDRAVQGMGLAAGAAIWVRYEALATAAMAAVALVVFAWLRRHDEERSREHRVGSLLITLLMPPIFFGGTWMLFNWLIQGDPLFFYNSRYSIQGALDVARNQPGHALAYAYGDVAVTIRYAVTRTMEASFLYPVLVVTTLAIAVQRRAPLGVVLVLLTASTLLLQVYQAYTGSIAPWLRYWVYVPLLSLVLLGWLSQHLRFHEDGGARQALRWAIIPAVILGTNGIAFAAMQGDTAGADERIFAAELSGRPDIARDLRRFYPDPLIVSEITRALGEVDGLVILDLENGGPVVLAARDSSRLVVNSDRDFGRVLQAPDRYARWLLLPDPRDESDLALARDEVYGRFGPSIWEGAPWLMLRREFDGDLDWRLYEIIGPVTAPSTDTATPAATPEASPTAGPAATGTPAGGPVTTPPQASP